MSFATVQQASKDLLFISLSKLNINIICLSIAKLCQEFRTSTKQMLLWSHSYVLRARLRGGAIAPGPRNKGASLMKFICFKWNTRLKNFCDSEAIQEYNPIVYSYVALRIRGPQQQLISLQEGCQTHFHWGPYQHYGCPQTASCNRNNHNNLSYASA